MNNYLFNDEENRQENVISVFTDLDGSSDEKFMGIEVKEEIPILPVRNLVPFPGVIMPVTIGRKASLRLVKEAERKGMQIGVFCQKQSEIENPELSDLHKVGVVAKVLRMLQLPDNTTTVIVQGFKRIKLLELTEFEPYLKGRVAPMQDILSKKDDKEFNALVEAVKDAAYKYIRLSDMVPPDSAYAVKNINNPLFLVDFLCANLPLKKDEKMEMLMMDSLKDRAYRLLELITREVQLGEIKASIQMRAREDIDQQQREYFLQQQIKTIQDELGGNGSRQEIEEMRKKANSLKWNEDVKKTFL